MKGKLPSGIEIIDLAIWLPDEKLLAISDLQLGNEGMLNAQGIFVPRVNFNAIKERLETKIFPALKSGGIETILINGDLKHEFRTISAQERREVSDIIDLLESRCRKVILVKGNHDSILEPIANEKKVGLLESYSTPHRNILFVHGDKEPAAQQLKKANIIVIGHQHPSVTISDGVKRERYKCFLLGKYKGKPLIVMPSMNAVTTGSDILASDVMSPLIKNIEGFEVFAVEGKVFYMGKAGNLKG